ncbi:MAG: DUF721 domain-containing protein [Chthonomonas sp.]|nr:DUF721 domain-containing protein [Chthonomonas sp.]
MADVLGEAIGRKEVMRAARAQLLFSRWGEAVGEHLAKNTKPDRFEKGTLWFTASGSAWSQETMLNKDVILDRLNEMAAEQLFLDLRASRALRKARDL